MDWFFPSSSRLSWSYMKRGETATKYPYPLSRLTRFVFNSRFDMSTSAYCIAFPLALSRQMTSYPSKPDSHVSGAIEGAIDLGGAIYPTPTWKLCGGLSWLVTSSLRTPNQKLMIDVLGRPSGPRLFFHRFYSIVPRKPTVLRFALPMFCVYEIVSVRFLSHNCCSMTRSVTSTYTQPDGDHSGGRRASCLSQSDIFVSLDLR